MGTESSPGSKEDKQAGRLRAGLCMKVERGQTALSVSGPDWKSTAGAQHCIDSYGQISSVSPLYLQRTSVPIKECISYPVGF